MKELINNQRIRIDNHQAGTKVGYFDDPKNDIHLDKTCYGNKKEQYRIRIPLNSDRPVKITDKYGNNGCIPKHLKIEIQKAFKNKSQRKAFISELTGILKNYPITNNSLEIDKAFDALKRIALAFGLTWNSEDIQLYTNKPKTIGLQCIALLEDNSKTFFLEIEKNSIIISDYKHIGHKYKSNWKKCEII